MVVACVVLFASTSEMPPFTHTKFGAGIAEHVWRANTQPGHARETVLKLNSQPCSCTSCAVEAYHVSSNGAETNAQSSKHYTKNTSASKSVPHENVSFKMYARKNTRCYKRENDREIAFTRRRQTVSSQYTPPSIPALCITHNQDLNSSR